MHGDCRAESQQDYKSSEDRRSEGEPSGCLPDFRGPDCRKRGARQPERPEKDDKTITCDEGSPLSKETDVLSKKPAFSAAAQDLEILATKGHGGEMLEKMREYNRSKDNLQKEHICDVFLERGTYQGRFNEIKLEAVGMMDKLVMNPNSFESLKPKFRELSIELFGLCDSLNQNIGEPKDNIKWDDVRMRMDVARNNGGLKYKNNPQFNVNQMKEGLEKIINLKNTNFSVRSVIPRTAGVQKQNQAENNEEALLPENP